MNPVAPVIEVGHAADNSPLLRQLETEAHADQIIVALGRVPIGRAMKGSLVNIRPG